MVYNIIPSFPRPETEVYKSFCYYMYYYNVTGLKINNFIQYNVILGLCSVMVEIDFHNRLITDILSN